MFGIAGNCSVCTRSERYTHRFWSWCRNP